jgi:hypothetical protein
MISAPAMSAKLLSLIRYLEKTEKGRDIIEFSDQAKADTAGHQMRDLGSGMVKVTIGAQRVVVELVK